MDNYTTQLARLVSDPHRVSALLALEKQRRAVPQDRLVFVGVANAASVHYCAMKAVLKSRAVEWEFFAAYLYDRLAYGQRLGLVTALPKAAEALLEVGAAITPANVERLLALEAEKERERTRRSQRVVATWQYQETRTPQGEVRWLINPDLPPQQRATYEVMAEAAGARVIDLEAEPLLRGQLLQASKAEKHPTIRWNFSWGPYVLVGVPDGITEGYVYEFKTTRSRYLGGHLRPSMLAQADLYGLFFERPAKRVQLFVVEEGATQTENLLVDPANAEAALEEFRRVDEGLLPRPPREAWKCRKCEVRAGCTICPLGPG